MYIFNFVVKKIIIFFDSKIIMVILFNVYKVGVFKIMYLILWGLFLKISIMLIIFEFILKNRLWWRIWLKNCCNSILINNFRF